MVKEIKRRTGRRRFISSTIAVAGFTMFGATGVGSADGRSNGGQTAIVLENGELTLDESGEGISSAQTATYNLDRILEGLNDEKQEGYLTFERHKGDVFANPTDLAREEYVSLTDGGVGTYCGTTAFDYKLPGLTRPYATYYFYLNDEDTEYVATRASQGAAVSGLASWIASATGAGTVAAGVLAALAAFLAISAAELSYKNDGCGVRIRVYDLPITPGPSWVSVSAQ
ncbi:hypothetical protein [Natronosalvus halobius]|uniref:hypothetical protein n=1 Tax=Natronosalvus halobius TaxID=2953746 RepID=UPI00209C7059|nr:hypothetical protein [Natronosalvus halobius]USZ70582.1 hypothetical protein NGM15_10735 [Natronosalvus halobius]